VTGIALALALAAPAHTGTSTLQPDKLIILSTTDMKGKTLPCGCHVPKGGIARFYGTTTIHRSGPIYDEVWKRLVQPEKDRDPDRKGFAVLIKVDRAEDLDGQPLT